jgi:hypothetical protein
MHIRPLLSTFLQFLQLSYNPFAALLQVFCDSPTIGRAPVTRLPAAPAVNEISPVIGLQFVYSG